MLRALLWRVFRPRVRLSGLSCSLIYKTKVFASYHDSGETPLPVRIGMSAGEPVAEDNDLFGTTVQLAARLCAHARPDQILAAPSAAELCSGEPSLLSMAGTVTPNGFTRSFMMYEVNWRGR